MTILSSQDCDHIGTKAKNNRRKRSTLQQYQKSWLDLDYKGIYNLFIQ